MQITREKILQAIQYNLHSSFELTDVMEMMRGDGENRWNIDICLKNVRLADVYIILIGKRFGSAPEQYTNMEKCCIQNAEGKSYTQLEYETACEVQKKKRYHIYKLELTEAFFAAETLDPKTDLADPLKKEKYEAFRKQLDETVSSIEVNSAGQLAKEVNDLLTKSFLIFKTILELKVSEEEQSSIDRRKQVDRLQTNLKQVRSRSNVVSLILNASNSEDDQTDLFSKKIRKLLRPYEDQEITRKLCWVDVNSVAGSFSENTEKLLDFILIDSSSNILRATSDFLTFDQLWTLIDKNNVQNRFFGFLIDLTQEDDQIQRFIHLVQMFVDKMNALLRSNSFMYRFYFIICVISKEDLEGKFVPAYMPGWESEYHDLGRLSYVEFSDIEDWLNVVITCLVT